MSDQGLRLRGPVLKAGTLRTGFTTGASATSPLSTHLPRLRLPPPPEVFGFLGFFGSVSYTHLTLPTKA